MRRIAQDANGTGADFVERKPWMDYQVWLDRAEHRVFIPFASALAEAVEPEAVRLRRDFKAVLGLIKAHAICHQMNRERDEHGRIVATMEDYSAVYEAVVDAVSEGIGKTVSETVRETVGAVASLAPAHPEGVSLGELSKALEADKSTASRRARTARHGGYLVNLEDRKGHPARYKIGEPLPDPSKALPEPKTLVPPHPPATPATPQHPSERNGAATVSATPRGDKSAGQGTDSGTVAGVAGVSGGGGEPLHSPLRDRCNTAPDNGQSDTRNDFSRVLAYCTECGAATYWHDADGLPKCPRHKVKENVE